MAATDMPASSGEQGPGDITSLSGPIASISSRVIPVVAKNLHLLPQLAEILDDVVGEGVVVIDHEQHNFNPPIFCLDTSNKLRITGCHAQGHHRARECSPFLYPIEG